MATDMRFGLFHKPLGGVHITWEDLWVTVSNGNKGGSRAILQGLTGPTHAANQFFSSNGFPCPALQNPSDHFLKTINKDFDEDIEEGKKPTEQVIEILVKSYISSDRYQEILTKTCHNEGEELEKNRNHANFLTQCQVLTRRSFKNMYRDLGYYWMRLAVYIALSIGLGTIFFDIGLTYSSIQARGSMLMFVASFLTFMAISSFPSDVEEIKVSERERLNGHYSSGAFVVGNTISSAPYLLLISLIPGAIAYFLTGLQHGIGTEKSTQHFIYFASILFVCMLLVESQMMIVSSLVPNFLMGIITGAGLIGLMVLGGGFFRLPNDLPKLFWKYPLYYLSFHKYAFQGLYKNEFQGRTFPNLHVEMGYSKWFGMVAFYRLLFVLIVEVDKVISLLSKRLCQVVTR
ncbi:hypothetical protein M9H77_20699 [Catharanthus roseus]|uniref:Uncharacterized protein n=1 Tax=Catharanthus roseus TaxID=4058 RepID=A0ACC0AKY4_CATRO|nr:hypothetical protein M9H77_20699 [Catharanthus roseus]